ncbi:hypothetical protein J6590_071835 [Homalodisca vitripennis]|nr:hypothetical protein J6590_071835 [Homalodisca vitripennis]
MRQHPNKILTRHQNCKKENNSNNTRVVHKVTAFGRGAISSGGSAAILTTVCAAVQYASSCASESIVRSRVLLLQRKNMSAMIENPAKCEVRGVVRFLWSKSCTAAEIHRELSAVYGPNIMREGRCSPSMDQGGKPSLVSDDLVNKVDEKIRKNRRFTISELSDHFPETFYCETLKWLRRAIQNKRHGLLTSGVVFVHDNARLHTAQRTTELLEKFKWDVFDPPPLQPGPGSQ